MTTAPINDLIDYLLKRQFGSLAPPPAPTPSGHNTHSDLHAFAEDRQREITAKGVEYRAMNPDEVRRRVELAREEDAKAAQHKAEQEEQALFFHQPHASADLAYWSKMATWTLEEAVAVSLGKNPGKVNWETVTASGESYIPTALAISPFRKEYGERRSLVSRAVTASELPLVSHNDSDGWRSTVNPQQFLIWALSTFDEMPHELIENVKARGKLVTDMQTVTAERDALKVRVAQLETPLQGGGKWPWGDHDTLLLGQLAAATDKFWKLYDPNDSTTAPTNATVVDWLVERGVAKRVAEVMAQMLRADGLQAGPRR